MNLARLPPWAWVGAGLGLVYLLGKIRVGQGSAATAAGKAIGRASVDLADGIVAGTVKGVGGAVSIPDTDPERCNAATAAGDTWNASLYCTAGSFIKYIFSPPPPKTKASAGTAIDAPLLLPWEMGCVAGVCGRTFEGGSKPLDPAESVLTPSYPSTRRPISVGGLRG